MDASSLAGGSMVPQGYRGLMPYQTTRNKGSPSGLKGIL